MINAQHTSKTKMMKKEATVGEDSDIMYNGTLEQYEDMLRTLPKGERRAPPVCTGDIL
jgi:hypothetical protein